MAKDERTSIDILWLLNNKGKNQILLKDKAESKNWSCVLGKNPYIEHNAAL